MKNTQWKITWMLAKRDNKTRTVLERKLIESTYSTKIKALDRYFFMMYGLPAKDKQDISELKIFKNNIDVTEKINSWLFSDRIN